MKAKIGIFKLTGCSGCQMEILRMEDIFLKLIDIVDVSYWVMVKRENEMQWDISFVEGSVSTAEEKKEIEEIRKKSKILVAFGDCAIGGCIPSIKNFISSHSFEGIEKFVDVDFTLKGCPPSRENIISLLINLLKDIKPRIKKYPVCVECKYKDNACLLKQNLPCMGPVTSAGCGALCPSLDRICEGCYGPMSNPNVESLAGIFKQMGLSRDDIIRKFRKYAGTSPEFYKEAGNEY